MKITRKLISLFVMLCLGLSLLDHPVAQAANLAVDGSFEASSLQWDVINPTYGTWTYDTTNFKAGSRSLRMSLDDSAYPHYFTFQQYYDTFEGRYFFEGYVRIDDLYNGANRPRFAFNIYPRTSGAFAPIFESFRMPADAPRNSWIKVSGTFDVPANARVFLQLFADGNSSQSSPGSAWFDGISILKYAAANAPRKKVIQYGWNAPDTRYVRDNWQSMETMPLDGAGIVVAINRSLPTTGNGATGNMLGWHVFGPTAYQLSNFQPAIDDLKTAKWQKLTDNFLPLAIASYDQDHNFSWFDDARWNTIINNWQVLVTIAKEGGCKGILFDPEHYDYSASGAELFNFQEQYNERDNTHTLEEYKAKVRARGYQLMSAAGQIYPDMTLFCMYAYYLAAHEPNRYSLVSSFLDGMLEGTHAHTKWVDLCEPSYGYKTLTQFQSGYNNVQTTWKTQSSVPNIYSARIRPGLAQWLDNGGVWNTTNFTANHFTPTEFAQSLQTAMEVSDEYVWIYSQSPGFFPRNNLPDEYIAAMEQARQAVATTENTLNNGGFETPTLQWEVVNPTKGTWAYDTGIVQSGTRSLRMSAIDSVYPQYFVLQQSSDALEGRYFFECHMRIDDLYNGAALPRVTFNITPRTAGDFTSIYQTFWLPSEAPRNTWVKVTGTVDVPPNARVYTQLFTQGTAGNAWFDGLSLR